MTLAMGYFRQYQLQSTRLSTRWSFVTFYLAVLISISQAVISPDLVVQTHKRKILGMALKSATKRNIFFGESLKWQSL